MRDTCEEGDDFSEGYTVGEEDTGSLAGVRVAKGRLLRRKAGLGMMSQRRWGIFDGLLGSKAIT